MSKFYKIEDLKDIHALMESVDVFHSVWSYTTVDDVSDDGMPFMRVRNQQLLIDKLVYQGIISSKYVENLKETIAVTNDNTNIREVSKIIAGYIDIKLSVIQRINYAFALILLNDDIAFRSFYEHMRVLGILGKAKMSNSHNNNMWKLWEKYYVPLDRHSIIALNKFHGKA